MNLTLIFLLVALGFTGYAVGIEVGGWTGNATACGFAGAFFFVAAHISPPVGPRP